MIKTKDRGNKGEEAAVKLLASKGYEILKRNYLCRIGEIDIIAEKSGRIAFIEVKARSEGSLASPKEFVTNEKQRKIVNTACVYIKENNIKKPVSFDVIEVFYDKDFEKVLKINHLENAFGSKRH